MYQEEHRIFREAYRKFLALEIVPRMEEWEREGIVPREAWEKMGGSGFLCPWLPEEYGGCDADFLYSVVIAEETARAGAVSLMNTLHSDIIAPYIFRLGTEEQKRRWLPRCAAGETILAVAMTEPDAGSDLAGMKTRAERDGDDYVINGTKTFISNGINADLVVVACRTDRKAKPSQGISLICVERDAPGFVRGRLSSRIAGSRRETGSGRRTRASTTSWSTSSRSGSWSASWPRRWRRGCWPGRSASPGSARPSASR
jgi:acyl-CoA dehydrogenase